jgi:hypothetical protein
MAAMTMSLAGWDNPVSPKATLDALVLAMH